MRICPECGVEMKKTFTFKTSKMRKNSHRYSCKVCNFEQSFTHKEEEDNWSEIDFRKQ